MQPYHRIIFYLIVFSVTSIGLYAQHRPTNTTTPLSEQRVSYDIKVRLNPTERSLTGRQRLTWTNPDKVPVDELQFHLYLNAFKENSTFMEESGGSHRGFSTTNENPWGGIEITEMRWVDENAPFQTVGDQKRLDGISLKEHISFIQPDDNNEKDETVIKVQLPKSVKPGEKISLDIDFEAQMPEIFARTGWQDKPNGKRFFMVAQWFPKIGVYEIPGQRYLPQDAPKGTWNTHQFHANSEFYADYGDYKVEMTVPNEYLLGASGIQTNQTTQDGETTYSYWATDVHDFAWTASNDFQVFEDTWEHVKLKLMVQPEHAYQAQRHFDAAKIALTAFSEWYGEYPYTTLTLVDGIGGSNGMEYPTLITCGTSYMLPSWVRLLELVTIHEFGHQYWYGLLGSNEFEESWLDEGINSYTELRIMDKYYGTGSAFNLPGLPISDSAIQRLSYTKNNPASGIIFSKSWEMSNADYGKASYAKPATLLATLEHYIGTNTMQQVMRTYYEQWRFKHPTTRDFQAVAEEISGQDLDWYFDQFVYDDVVIDYAVASIEGKKAVLSRLGDGIFPQKVMVKFTDGTKAQFDWEGQEKEKILRYAKEIESVYLDPEDKVWLDINRFNNRKAITEEPALADKYRNRFMVWVQQIIAGLSGLV